MSHTPPGTLPIDVNYPPTPEEPLLAWHNDPALKLDTVGRMREHADLDQIIQGSYIRKPWPTEGGSDDGTSTIPYQGCFLGCLVTEHAAARTDSTVEDIINGRNLYDWHAWAAYLFGIPTEVAWLIECVFELLDENDASRFAVEVLDAIPVGADLTGIPSAVGAEAGSGTRRERWRWTLAMESEVESEETLMHALRTAPVQELTL